MRLRRATYGLIVGLRDDDSGDTDLSDRLRQSLSEWLTVPVFFAKMHAPVLDELRDPDLVGKRWGEEVRRYFEDARESLARLRETDSPLRAQLAQLIREAAVRDANWRIYCHRGAVEHFVSCANAVGVELDTVRFIHSLRQYRDAAPFEVLIKVGPLRARGWGSFISAGLNAPRYQELAQVVWSGMCDEAGIGDDPITSLFRLAVTGNHFADSVGKELTGEQSALGGSCTRKVVMHLDGTEGGASPAPSEEPTLDELAMFSNMGRVNEPRSAILLHFGGGLGVLYPPNADVLLLSAGEPTANSVKRITLAEAGELRNRFLICPHVGDVNLGLQSIEHGWYSSHWKAELERQYQHHAEGLERKLRAAGMTLRNLRGCVEHWIHPASSVIHAPQQRKHFQILIEVLEMEARTPRPGSTRSTAQWWESAWQEIAASRGLAIQFGMQENEIVDEEIEGEVLAILPELRERAQAGEIFRITIPQGHSLEGSISFYPICDVETGFSVPESALKTLMPISGAEQWRV